jgi:3-hydroxyisobutyrate dehydrogenase
METIGFVGVGKIGMPISQNLIKSGYRVVGYRRHSLAEFEKIGGVPARSSADVGAQADIVLSCMPSTAALDEVVHGPHGLIHSARPGQIVVELGSHPVPDKKRQIAQLAEKGAVFIDGEVSGTPGMAPRRARRSSRWSRVLPIPVSISASSAPRAASSSSTIFWSRSTSPPRRKR